MSRKKDGILKPLSLFGQRSGLRLSPWQSTFNRHPDIINGKKVLELAAGLGLPSIVAAHYAEHVCCSDYIEDAVDAARQNVLHNRLHNVDCRVYNWNDLPDDLSADILLMSDVNYEPENLIS